MAKSTERTPALTADELHHLWVMLREIAIIEELNGDHVECEPSMCPYIAAIEFVFGKDDVESYSVAN